MRIKLHCSKTLAFGSGNMAITGRFDDAAYASFYGEGSHPWPVSSQRTAERLSSLAFLRK
jgi:hypothetical protein